MDFDPEEIETAGQEDHSDSEQSVEQDNAYTGREHYEEVGKSRLRKPAQPKLGAQYAGSSVSRSALDRDESEFDPLAPVDDSGDEDPFAKPDAHGNVSGAESVSEVDESLPTGLEGDIDEDEEVDSDEAFGEDDEERFKEYKFSGSKKSRVVRKETENGSLADEPNDEDGDEDMQDVSELDPEDQEEIGSDESSEDMEASDIDSESTTSTTPDVPASAPSSNREALKAILANDTATVASTLSAAAESDARKGRAVKQQCQTFDRLLDARIKLQKGLTAANALPSSQITESEHRDACLKAEEAALTLWSTISSLRHTLLSHSQPSQQKRKRPTTPATTSTPTSSLWAQTTALEAQSLPHRRATLDKWCFKSRPASILPTANTTLIDRTPNSNPLTTILDAHLASLPHPPLFSSQSQLYDDSPFYQSLLRSLIASRSSSSTTTTLLPSKTLHAPGSRSKPINTKASKGRAVRYTVHEKLQNFVAEEQRGTWSEAASREFFGSLFGGRGALGEDDDDQAEDEMRDREGGDREGEALRLFRR